MKGSKGSGEVLPSPVRVYVCVWMGMRVHDCTNVGACVLVCVETRG